MPSRIRARPHTKGVCWCCCSIAHLYWHGSAVGIKAICARCAHDTYGCKAGFTRDGVRMKSPEQSK